MHGKQNIKIYMGVVFIFSASNLCFCRWLDYHFRSALFQLLDYYSPFLRSLLSSSARAVYFLGSYTPYGFLMGLPRESGVYSFSVFTIPDMSGPLSVFCGLKSLCYSSIDYYIFHNITRLIFVDIMTSFV